MKTIELAPGERLVTNQLNRKGVLPQNIVDAARDIVANVRANGDAAVRDYCQRFDGVELQSFRLPQEQIDAALEGLDPAFVAALEKAARQIREFHERRGRAELVLPRARTARCSASKVTPLDRGWHLRAGRPCAVSLHGAHERSCPPRSPALSASSCVTPPHQGRQHRLGRLHARRGKARRRDRDLHGRRRPGRGGAGLRHRDHSARSARSPARATPSWPLPRQIVSGDVGIDMIAGPSEVCVRGR